MKVEWVEAAYKAGVSHVWAGPVDDKGIDLTRRIITAFLVAAEKDGFKLLGKEATREMLRAGGAFLDHPSVYMGGASKRSMDKAQKLFADMHEAALNGGGNG